MMIGLLGWFIRLVVALIGLWFMFVEYTIIGPVGLLISIVVALIALKLVGFLGIRIPVTLWSLLICILFGIPGLLVMMILSVTGIAFRGR